MSSVIEVYQVTIGIVLRILNLEVALKGIVSSDTPRSDFKESHVLAGYRDKSINKLKFISLVNKKSLFNYFFN